MSGPASAYSYSEYTVAPSEASLNARWYTQIQQWTNRVPPRTSSSAISGHASPQTSRDIMKRGRDVDEGTEAETVLPTHSVSRRASLAERRRWGHQQEEQVPSRLVNRHDVVGNDVSSSTRTPTTPTKGMAMVEASNRQTRSQSRADDRNSQLQQADHGPSRITSPLVPTVTAAGTNRPVYHDGAESTPSNTGSQSGTRFSRIEHQVQYVAEDIPARPSRGRRPPTPYHPPSDVALSDIPEISVGERGEAEQREIATNQPGKAAVVKPRTRYPPSVLRTASVPLIQTERGSSAVEIQPLSERKSLKGTYRENRQSFMSQSNPPRAAPSSQPTDHSSFPPLSTNPRDMTVVPEDSISRVEPRDTLAQSSTVRPIRRDEDRGRSRESKRDSQHLSEMRSRRREQFDSRDSWRGYRQHKRSRTRHRSRSRGDSSSDSSSSGSSAGTRSRSSSSGSSTPPLGMYTARTMSPPVVPRRPSIAHPAYRISSPPMIPLVRPSITTSYPYMSQPISQVPMSPIQPIHPHMMPMQLPSPQIGHHPWSAGSNISSINLARPPASFGQVWTPHHGPASQVPLGNQLHPGTMQQFFNGRSLGGDNAWKDAGRRGSMPQPLNHNPPSGQAMRMNNMRPPRPLRAASLPVVKARDGTANVSSNRFTNKPLTFSRPNAAVKNHPFPNRTRGLASKTPENRLLSMQPRVSARPRGGEVPGMTRPQQRRATAGAMAQVAPRGKRLAVPGRPPRVSKRGGAVAGRGTDAPQMGARGGKGLGWMKGLLPPYGRP